LTCPRPLPTLYRLSSRQERARDETDVPAEPAPAREDARLPRADEDAGRAENFEATAGEGAETADGLSGRLPRQERLTRSAEFQALFQKGKRVDRPSLIVLWRDADASRRVGFAVSRQLGTAVKRNRVRRRLREAYRRSREAAPADIGLVIIGRPGALTVDFNDLVAEMRDALAGIARSRART
jgi:ribonuclease P protein component